MLHANSRKAARAVLIGLLLSCLGCNAPSSGPVAVAQSEPQNPEAAASATAATGAPHIVFAEPVYDFGKVEQGEQVTHMFRFTNQGGQELRVESVKTSCGCTAAVISEEVLPPGKEGTISATFDTTHFSGEKAKGISVYSNDPLQPVTTLTLQGEITIEVAADPAQLYLGRLRRREEITRSTDVLYDAQKPIDIVKIENSHPSLSVQAEDFSTEGKKGKKLIVTLKKDAPLGRLNDQIVVTTTSQKKPVLEIPVFGSVEGDMLVLPPQVSFGVVRRGESKTQEISIKNRGSKPVQVVRVQNSAPEVVAELTPVKQGEEYRLTLRTKGESKLGRIQGEVQIFTDHPEEKVLTIPLYGIVAEGEQAKRSQD
jgi:hypothetical protein